MPHLKNLSPNSRHCCEKAKAKTMEAPSDNDNSTSWISETNWTIDHGSLDASVTFESSDYPTDSENVNSKIRSPLILKPPSPDCGPCEIKISFTQKHEVRQVYVRSTARVYEIYYASALQSSNEYLCTVRCGIAARDQELLHAADIEEPVCEHFKGSAGELAKEKFKDDGNTGTSEDDWVEVKAPDSPLQDNRNSSLPVKIDANTGTIIQDLYEATAEITDADPCISLTLRLLSLQSKGCVYVDEVYVFADPVESANSDNQAVQAGNSAESSLMAMLVPTLLQLSKTGVSRIQNKHASDTMEQRQGLEIGSSSTSFGNGTQQDEKFSIADQQDVNLPAMNKATAEPPQVQIPTKVLDGEQKHDSVLKGDLPYGRIERALEQLVSRVSRIEDICSRFEENMLKPISNMEARLQRVEQQLEVLAKNSLYSVFPSGTRISAPAFSCNESNSSSSYNDGNDYPACGALELEKKDFSSVKLSNSPDDMSISVNATQILRSLVVTAPEFSCADAEEDNDASEPSKGSPQEKPKQALSIDDALAAALAGFLTTTTVQSSNYTQTLTIKAPEFTIEENGSDDEMASPSGQNEEPVVPSVFSCESNGTECINNSVSTSNGSSSVEGVEQVLRNLNDGHFEETPKGVDAEDQFYEEVTSCSFLGTSVDFTPAQAEHDLAKTNDCQITEETNRREFSSGVSDVSVSEETENLKHFLGNQTEDGSDALQEGAASSAEDIAVVSDKGILQDVLKSSCASAVVDFEIPILEVKFASSGNCSTKSPLEALLTDMPEFNVQAPCVQESDDVVIEQSNPIPVEDGESMGPLTDNHLLVDLDSFDVRDVPSTLEGEELQDPYTCSNQEMFGSLI
uniref:Uncharacterized protein n=1 Tax=Davidia involucrata TaxID=16924 RepID=A0A5B6ZBJ1_DAVIN